MASRVRLFLQHRVPCHAGARVPEVALAAALCGGDEQREVVHPSTEANEGDMLALCRGRYVCAYVGITLLKYLAGF